MAVTLEDFFNFDLTFLALLLAAFPFLLALLLKLFEVAFPGFFFGLLLSLALLLEFL
jgi:hypothetical protein